MLRLDFLLFMLCYQCLLDCAGFVSQYLLVLPAAHSAAVTKVEALKLEVVIKAWRREGNEVH